jgi:hypothetical protein
MHSSVTKTMSATNSAAISNTNLKPLHLARKISLGDFIRSTLFVGLALVGQTVTAGEQDTMIKNAAQYSGGISIGLFGLGLSLSSKTDWSLAAGDQIQWRILASGIEGDFEGDDDVDFSGIDYNDGDFSMFSLQAGIDWYPVNAGWADEVFLSTGLMYTDLKFNGTADNSKTYFVGNTLVTPGDISSLKTETENTSVMPYVSLGWGNKITPEGGFNFHAEIGAAIPTHDSDVTLTVVDPGNFLNSSALAKEKKEIEDEIDGVMGFATATISYHF